VQLLLLIWVAAAAWGSKERGFRMAIKVTGAGVGSGVITGAAAPLMPPPHQKGGGFEPQRLKLNEKAGD